MEQHDAGAMHPEWIRSYYYRLVGSGAGFLILAVEDPYALTEMLAPLMRLMTWDVRAIVPYDYDQDIAEFRPAFGDSRGTGPVTSAGPLGVRVGVQWPSVRAGLTASRQRH